MLPNAVARVASLCHPLGRGPHGLSGQPRRARRAVVCATAWRRAHHRPQARQPTASHLWPCSPSATGAGPRAGSPIAGPWPGTGNSRHRQPQHPTTTRCLPRNRPPPGPSAQAVARDTERAAACVGGHGRQQVRRSGCLRWLLHRRLLPLVPPLTHWLGQRRTARPDTRRSAVWPSLGATRGRAVAACGAGPRCRLQGAPPEVAGTAPWPWPRVRRSASPRSRPSR